MLRSDLSSPKSKEHRPRDSYAVQQRMLAETGAISMSRQAKILLEILNIFPCLHSACYEMEKKDEINLKVSICET